MKYLVGIISVLVVVVLVGSVMVPIINDSTNGGVEYEDNPDWDGWVRFDLNTSASAAYHLTMWQDDNGVYVNNLLSEDVMDTQTYDDSVLVDYETITYADSSVVIWTVDDHFSVLGKVNDEPVSLSGTSIDVIRNIDGVTVTNEDTFVTYDSPTWAYVPLSQGKYGFYHYAEDRGVEHPANAPTAVLGGGFAGVYAYNNIYTYDGLGLAMNPIVEGGMYYGATWEKQSADEGESNPDDITITPLDPSVISGGDDTGIAPDNPPIVIDDPFEPDADITAVPTPTYTDGDWGYDLVDNNTHAKIVSYSGTGGGVIEIPSTVGGYTVTELGKGSSSNYNIFDSSVTCTQLVIPSTVTRINQNAFRTCSGLGGELVIPSNVTRVDAYAFRGCSGFTGLSVTDNTLFYPDNLDTSGAFWGCTGFTGTAILPKLSSYSRSANIYTQCSGFTSLVIPADIDRLPGATYSSCTGMVGTLVIPSNITALGLREFDRTNFDTMIYASDYTPYGSDSSNTSFGTMNNIRTILDLSSSGVFSENRYYLPNSAVIENSIGDCIGFISTVSIAHNVPGAMGQYSNLVYAIPIIIIAALLMAFVASIIRRDY